MPAPMIPDGQINKKLQGGLPPVPYRTSYARWDEATSAREPYACKEIKGEVLATQQWERGYDPEKQAVKERNGKSWL